MSEWIFLQDAYGELYKTTDKGYASWLCKYTDMIEVDHDSCIYMNPATDDDYQEFLKGGTEESDDIDDE